MSARRWTNDFFPYLVGACLAIASVFFGMGPLRDWLRFHDVPIQLGVDEAARTSREGRQWVRVTAAWQCDRAQDQNRATWVPARTSDDAVVVAKFFDLRDCARSTSAGVQGVIEPMSPALVADLAQRGLVMGSEPGLHVLDVCQTCGRGDARLGVILCGLGLLLGVGFAPIMRIFGRGGYLLGARLVAAGPARLRSASVVQDVRLAGRDALLWGLAFAAAGGVSWLLDWRLARAGEYYRIPVGLCFLGSVLVVLGLVQWRTGRPLAFVQRSTLPIRYVFVMAASIVLVLVGWPRLVDAIWSR